MKGAGLVIAACMAASSACAQEIPRFDPVAECKRIAAVGGSFSETTYGFCLDREQSAYDDLKPSWASIPTHIQKECERIGRVGGAGSYTTLKFCIERELRAGQANQSRQFKF